MEEQQVNINLCLEVEKYPCLYDVTLADHSRRSVVEKAWAEVGRALGLSGEASKKRWVNLRTVYVRKKSTSKSGSAAQKVYYLNKYMQFLLPHVKLPVKSTGSNLSSLSTKAPNRQLGEENSQQDASQHQDKSLTRDSGEQNIENRPELPHNENSTSSVDFQTTPTIHVNSAKNPRKTAKPSSDVDQAFVEYFQAKKQKVGTDSECPRKQFLLSLLPEVSDLPETKFRMFKRRVFGFLDNLHVSDPPLDYTTQPPMTSNTASSYSESRSPLFSPESLSLQDYDSFGGTRPLAIPMQSSSFQTACENDMDHIITL